MRHRPCKGITERKWNRQRHLADANCLLAKGLMIGVVRGAMRRALERLQLTVNRFLGPIDLRGRFGTN